MAYNMIFSKSFSLHEQKKFGYWAIIGSFVLALSFLSLLKNNFDPLPILNLSLSMGTGFPMLVTEDRSSSQPSNIFSSQPSVFSSQPSNISSSQQLNIGSSQALTTKISQKSNISSSQPSISDSPRQPLSTSNFQQSNISSSQPSIIGNSQQSNRSSSHQPLKSSSQPSIIGNSQQSNRSSSNQPLKSSSQPSIIGNSQQSNRSSSHQPLNKSSLQPSAGDITLKLLDRKPICNVSDPRFDFCDAEGDVRIHGNSSTIFACSSQMGVLIGNDSWTVKPYSRKTDKTAMKSIQEFSVKAIGSGAHEEAPSCTVNHSVPAIIFSTGGYAGNHFHAISDIIIPLFVTSAKFQGEVQFVVTNFQNYWIDKFQAILKQLSKYEIINIDTDKTVHCFPRMILGLKPYKDLTIDPLMSLRGHSMKELFRQLIRKAYSLKKLTSIKMSDLPTGNKKPPRLLIISRKRSRAFQNVHEIADLAKSLGFEVVVSEATMNLDKFAKVVNSCDVMMGIHGAGLTNLVFLPTNAILIQVLPWGGFEWVATNFYGQPAMDMDSRYLEYKIKEEESSLLQHYPLDHPVFRDPTSVHKHDWAIFKSVYLDKQNVKINLDRFRVTLLQALKLLHQ
ncbi:hypothetical protein NE237_008050 [Protea cynaroides]|uniref:Glycosyltransferase 61 catalytic domain-containing protein n=1 Tax=Protea cynaroides TaxID=273540 RepID=A0A9Q0KQK3_9MAGN|nr:hypothetical protein NE237_008050 [Protea cynaroides]